MKGRQIIRIQGLVISGLLTHLLIRYGFQTLQGWRLIVVIVAAFVLIFRTMDDITLELLRRGNDQKRKGQGAGGAVPTKPWYENRFRRDQQKDRHQRNNATKIQA